MGRRHSAGSQRCDAVPARHPNPSEPQDLAQGAVASGEPERSPQCCPYHTLGHPWLPDLPSPPYLPKGARGARGTVINYGVGPLTANGSVELVIASGWCMLKK